MGTGYDRQLGRGGTVVGAVASGLGGLLGLGLALAGVAALARGRASGVLIGVTVVAAVLGVCLLRAAWHLGRGQARPETGGLFSPTSLRVAGVGFLAGGVAAAWMDKGWGTALTMVLAGFAALSLGSRRAAADPGPQRIDRDAVTRRVAEGADAEQLMREFGCSRAYARAAVAGELPPR